MPVRRPAEDDRELVELEQRLAKGMTSPLAQFAKMTGVGDKSQMTNGIDLHRAQALDQVIPDVKTNVRIRDDEQRAGERKQLCFGAELATGEER